MSTGSGAGRGGIALFATPGRVPRGVAFAPAVRGYPGGIADMASDLDEPGADEPVGDRELWAITAGAERGDAPSRAGHAPGRADDAPDPVQEAAPILGQPAQRGSRQAKPAPDAQVSVWQQSAAAWQEARIDWLQSATAGAVPADSTPAANTLARPASSLPAEDGPHTEPLPVIIGDAALMPGARSGQESPAATATPAGRKQARAPRASARTDDTAASTDRAPGTADAPEGAPPGTAPAGPAGNGHTTGQPGADEGAAGSIPQRRNANLSRINA